jgi:hypothetical protein
MVFFGKYKNLLFHAVVQLESFLALAYWYTEIFSWIISIGVFHFSTKLIGLNGIGFLCYSIVLFPIWTTKIPIAEENFLSCPKHALRIENAIVSNESFKTIVMYSAK